MGIKAMVMSKNACMPACCWGQYRRCGVVIVDTDQLPEGESEPRMLSIRARGVLRVVETWEDLNVGVTDRCAFARAEVQAEALAYRINTNPQVMADALAGEL